MPAPTRSIAQLTPANLAPEEALLHPERYEWEAFSPAQWPFRAGEQTGLRLTCRHCDGVVTHAEIPNDMLICETCGHYRFSIQKLAGRKSGAAEVSATETPEQKAGQEPGQTEEKGSKKGAGNEQEENNTRKGLKIFLWLFGLLATFCTIIGILVACIFGKYSSLSNAVSNRHQTAASLFLALDTLQIYGLCMGGEYGRQWDLDHAIYSACLQGDADMVKRLQQHGANINSRELGCPNLLESAIRSDDINHIRFALEHGADANGIAAIAYALNLRFALQEEPIDMVRLLLQYGASVNACYDKRHPGGMTPLHLAADKGYEQVCQLLLQHGARVNASNELKETPLHLAAKHGHEHISKLLLQHGADANNVKADGDSILITAIRKHEAVIVRQLLEHGANVHFRNKYGDTALKKAIGLSNKETRTQIINLLKQYGAKE